MCKEEDEGLETEEKKDSSEPVLDPTEQYTKELKTEFSNKWPTTIVGAVLARRTKQRAIFHEPGNLKETTSQTLQGVGSQCAGCAQRRQSAKQSHGLCRESVTNNDKK